MNSGNEHKLFNYEVTPPPGVWDKITTALDESELHLRFPSALYNLEVSAPATAWQAISEALEAKPAYAAKLAGMSMTPPATAWGKIEASLDPVIKERKKITPVFRYAAAAMITGLLAWGGYQLFTGKPGETKLAEQPVTITTEESARSANLRDILDEQLAVSDVTASLEEARNDAALEASKKTFARLDTREKKSKFKNVHEFLFIADEYEPPNTRGLSFEPDEIRPPSIADRYILLMTPEGKMIRMSKKLGELVCCVSGEEQDKDCVDQLKKWREKMAHPAMAHSSGNIMDILSLLQSSENE